MKSRPLIFTGILAITIASFFLLKTEQVSSAEEATPERCLTEVVDKLGDVHDEFRAHVFGSRTNENGGYSILSGGTWNRAVPGILETKERLASELVWPIVESYRVYRCHSIAVCQAMQQSFTSTEATGFSINTLGCAPRTVSRLLSCSFQQNPALNVTGQSIAQLTEQCGTLVQDSLNVERSILRMAISYDSGYRAALQLGGMIDWMQKDLPTSALAPLRDMVRLLGKLHEIPCFIGQCDQPNVEHHGL